MIKTIALIAAIALPLFNIPLIVRMIRRKSSDDMSISWALGVWACFLLMAPESFRSPDLVWRVFNIVNLLLFTIVTATVLWYRRRR